jgi:hypothetical protein
MWTDLIDLFISVHLIFFVDSLSNVHDQANLFGDMRQYDMDLSFDDLLAELKSVVFFFLAVFLSICHKKSSLY